MNSVTPSDLGQLLGHPGAAIPKTTLDVFKGSDWRYDFIQGGALDALVAGMLERIRLKEFSIVVEGDKSRWVKGWGENLSDFVASEGNVDALSPKYVRPNMPVRLFRRLVQPSDPNFEANWRRVYQDYIFRTYFADATNIFEFGCGSGMHVGTLAQMYPDKKVTGLDWAEPSVEIVENMRKLRGWNTQGRSFDFYNPDDNVEIPEGSVVLTFAALEQISDKPSAFVDFLLRKRPKLVVHLEPIYDWYDPANFIDHLAMRAHETRNFLRGLVGTLHKLRDEGRVELVKEQRVEFGSLLHEGYSQLIWRPI